MNRQIKFRIWDKVNNKFLWFFSNDLFDTIFAQSHSDGPIIQARGKIFIRSNIDYEINQFTGLHDKNGKEIYEKDILKQIYYPMGADKKIIEYYKIGVVIYGSHFFGLQLKIEGTNVLDESKKLSHHRTRKEVYKHPSAGGDWVDNSFYGEYEIIGNVYENQELLNK